MNVKHLRSTRIASLLLAASLVMGTSAMAAGTAVTEVDTKAAVVNEQDVPIEVGRIINGTALGVGTVETATVNVRVNPNMDAEVVATLNQGAQVVVLTKDGDWYRISCEGITGFIDSSYVSVVNEGEADLGYGMLKCASANIRASADTEGDTIATIGEEDVVEIQGVTDGWYEVTVNGSTGYIRSDLVDPTAEIPAEKIFDYAVITCNAANLRSEPDSAAEKTDVLYSTSLCKLVKQVGDWYEVEYGGKTGYILASLMTTTNNAGDGSTNVETYNDTVAREQAEAAAAAAAAAQAAAEQAAAQTPSYDDYDDYDDNDYSYDDYDYDDEDEDDYEEPEYNYSGSSSIVSVAMNYMGVPYVWGGTTPSGFDCSGFTQYVFRQCGYSINRIAADQYYNGYHVSYDNLQSGDLVFFANTYSASGITHVGIYIGGGEFIHAASGGVKISSLSESYYSSRYYGACRVA
ncbi:MAG: SH3 domain-containing protein [Oscillospiraceae bacterium]|nr:SH3 domain-containing protein [Oscillospiraceae bacterium]